LSLNADLTVNDWVKKNVVVLVVQYCDFDLIVQNNERHFPLMSVFVGLGSTVRKKREREKGGRMRCGVKFSLNILDFASTYQSSDKPNW
jgi:hypothetical protein